MNLICRKWDHFSGKSQFIEEFQIFHFLVKTRHHRGNREDKRILVKRADVGMEDDQDLPEIMTPGQVIRREIGHTAVLGCNVQNLGKYVVMWKQNGRVISGILSF